MRGQTLHISLSRNIGRMRYLLPACILMIGSLRVHSQVNSFSDQYLANLYLINPAIAGTGQYGTLSVSSRQQWAGWSGAPASQSVTYNTKLAKANTRFNPLGFVNKGKNTYSKLGFGGGFIHESYGVFNLTGVHMAYSYHVYANRGRLSFGLAPQIFQVSTSSLLLADPNDPYLKNPVRAWFIDFNAGVHYFTKKYYAGLSLVQLANSAVMFGNYGYPGSADPGDNPDLAFSAYAYGGYFFNIDRNREFRLEPSGVVKYNAVEGIRFDVSTAVHYKEMVHAGLSYSFLRGLSFFTGVKLDNLSFRYLFQVPVSADLPDRYTTHQIQMGINIGEPIE